MFRLVEAIGRRTVGGIDQVGLGAVLLAESVFWLVAGRRRRQPVRLSAAVAQMLLIGVQALPISTILAATIGLMLAIQGHYTLGLFGAESFAPIGIALSVVREFSPLIIGILVAGRTGSALAARLGTMEINQEIDALRVIGINPVRFLVVPALVALIVMMPALVMWANLVALAAAGLYVTAQLGTTMTAFAADTIAALSVGDLTHGLAKSVLFALLIALIGAVNGAMVRGGAEGIGRATTQAVVQSIAAIVIADMVFAFVVTR